MNYTDLLNKIVITSGLKNIEIVEKLKEKGISITPNYLSVLRNDPNKTGSDELNKAICEICKAQYTNVLTVQAQIDKSDGAIKEYVLYTIKLIAAGAMTESQKYDEEEKKKGLDKLFQLSEAEIICDILAHQETDAQAATEIEYVLVPKVSYIPLKIFDPVDVQKVSELLKNAKE